MNFKSVLLVVLSLLFLKLVTGFNPFTKSVYQESIFDFDSPKLEKRDRMTFGNKIPRGVNIKTNIPDTLPRNSERQNEDVEVLFLNNDFYESSGKLIYNKLLIINRKTDTLKLPTEQRSIDVLLQAKNVFSKWRNVEYNKRKKRKIQLTKELKDEVSIFGLDSWWMDSNYKEPKQPKFKLKKNEYLQFFVPVSKGRYKTKLRYRINYNEEEVYSNEFQGYISYSQFFDPR